MPSRKKAQGKARKAAKTAEATRKEDGINRRLEACETQLQRLRLEDDGCCKHGCDKPDDDTCEFMKEYLKFNGQGVPSEQK